VAKKASAQILGVKLLTQLILSTESKSMLSLVCTRPSETWLLRLHSGVSNGCIMQRSNMPHVSTRRER